MLKEVFGIVLDVAFSLDDSVEQDNDEPAPCAGIVCTDLRQMICLQHQRLAGNEAERSLAFFLCEDIVRRAELLDMSNPHGLVRMMDRPSQVRVVSEAEKNPPTRVVN